MTDADLPAFVLTHLLHLAGSPDRRARQRARGLLAKLSPEHRPLLARLAGERAVWQMPQLRSLPEKYSAEY